jgi:phosphoglycerate dehydrogenase-like enzyme
MIQVSILPYTTPFITNSILKMKGIKVENLSQITSVVIWTDPFGIDDLHQILQTNPNIQFVQLMFSGVETLQSLYCFPVKICCTKGEGTQYVAEHALALALSLIKKIPNCVKARKWTKKIYSSSLINKKVLIIGKGGIGESLFSLLEPFNCNISFYNKDTNLQDIISNFEIIFIACPLTQHTKKLFSKSLFEKMNPCSILINVARGEIIDTEDLTDALLNQKISGVGLDVIDPEPLQENHALWNMDNVIITSHNLYHLLKESYLKRVIENIESYSNNLPLKGMIDFAKGY